MREDMAKVIVERPRVVDARVRRPRREAIEDAPARVSMRHCAKTSGITKYFSDNLSPLIRCIDKQVGRSWNKVFSEMSLELNLASPVQYHLRLHIDELVKTRLGQDAGRSFLWFRFYVDEKGILRRTRDRAKAAARKPAAPDRQVVRDGDREFRRQNGLWFEVVGEGHALARPADRPPYDEPWRAYQQPTGPRLRQVSRRELRRLGLQNDLA
jgi:hypothetical protein